MSRPRKMTDQQVEAAQERSRLAWNRMVERDEQAELDAVVNEATGIAKDAARRSR